MSAQRRVTYAGKHAVNWKKCADDERPMASRCSLVTSCACAEPEWCDIVRNGLYRTNVWLIRLIRSIRWVIDRIAEYHGAIMRLYKRRIRIWHRTRRHFIVEVRSFKYTPTRARPIADNQPLINFRPSRRRIRCEFTIDRYVRYNSFAARIIQSSLLELYCQLFSRIPIIMHN